MTHTIAVIGLGYVGLPLAVEFGQQHPPEALRSNRPGWPRIVPREVMFEALSPRDSGAT